MGWGLERDHSHRLTNPAGQREQITVEFLFETGLKLNTYSVTLRRID